MVRVRVFGQLEVEVDGQPVPLPRSRRAQALLAWLAVHPGRHARTWLAAQFWPGVMDSSARTSLRGALTELRRSLGPAAEGLVATRDHVGLSSDAVEVDARSFASAMGECDWAHALQLADGPALVGFDDDWADRWREEHTAELLLAVTRLAEEREADGRMSEAVSLARRRVRLDPLSEQAGRELVRLLAAAGDRAAALDAGRDLTERLERELGVEPDARTLSLLAELRRSKPVESSRGVPVPHAVARAPQDLIGRTGPLQEIRAARVADSSRVVLVRGDAGIGKTAVALAAARQAVEEGAAVLYGRCDEEAIVPYGPWVEALGLVFSQLDGHEARRVAVEGGPELARLFPQLGDPQPVVLESTQAEPDTLRWRLFEVIATIVSTLAESRPVVIVFDDVHWADRSSLSLLRHLLRTRPELPLTVVLTARDAETPRDAPLREALAQVRRDEPVTQLDLAGLDEAEVAELVRRRRGDSEQHQLVRTLHQETEGNPFFVEEILRNIPRAPVSGGLSGTIHVPEGVQDLVRQRLRRLDGRAQAVLTAAAVIGRDFELPLLERTLSLDGEDVLDALDSAVEASLVVEVAVGRYSFAHALNRSALYESLSRTRRARLHLRVAQALEELPGQRAGSRAADLAHHYLEGGDSAHLGRVVDHLREACRQAMDQFAYGEAAAHADQAIQAVDAAPVDTTAALPPLLLELGEAQSRSGDTAGARATFSRAARLAREKGDGSLLAAAALGFAGPSWQHFGVVDEEAIALLDEALVAVPPSLLALRARLQARLAIALYFARQPDRLSQLTAASVTAARRLDDFAVLAAALEARLWETWRPDGVSTRIETADELLALATSTGAAETAAAARRWRVVALLEQGRTDEAWTEMSRHAEDAHRLRLPYELMYVAVFATMRALLDGRLEAAADASARVAAFGELRGGADALQFGGVHALTFAHLSGGLTALVEGLEAFARGYPALPAWRGALAYALAAVGRGTDAAQEIDALWPPDDTLPFDAVWLPGLVFMSLAVLQLQDVSRAGELYRLLAPHAHRPVVLGAGGAVWGTVNCYLAELADLMGDGEAAHRHRDEAREEMRRLGAVGWSVPSRQGADAVEVSR